MLENILNNKPKTLFRYLKDDDYNCENTLNILFILIILKILMIHIIVN